MVHFHKLRQLSQSERRLLWQAWKLVALTRLMLWILPLEKVRSVAAKVGSFQPHPLESTIWAVRAASARVPGATCLVQAIALQTLLQKQGIATQLVIGVTMNGGNSFGAHAWVERQGRILIGEAKDADFQPILRLEPEPFDAPRPGGRLPGDA